jgi:methionine-S-sulfoxide reductase
MNVKEIWLAGGCFWGVEAFFEKIAGFLETTVGYANGKTTNPTYRELKNTGHVETVYVKYDADKIGLFELLEYYFTIIDPTILNRQGPDVGTQYRTGVYYADDKDLPVILSMMELQQKRYDKPLVTEVKPLEHFYPAEEYHQKYLKKNPGGYCHVDLSKKPVRIK